MPTRTQGLVAFAEALATYEGTKEQMRRRKVEEGIAERGQALQERTAVEETELQRGEAGRAERRLTMEEAREKREAEWEKEAAPYRLELTKLKVAREKIVKQMDDIGLRTAVATEEQMDAPYTFTDEEGKSVTLPLRTAAMILDLRGKAIDNRLDSVELLAGMKRLKYQDEATRLNFAESVARIQDLREQTRGRRAEREIMLPRQAEREEAQAKLYGAQTAGQEAVNWFDERRKEALGRLRAESPEAADAILLGTVSQGAGLEQMDMTPSASMWLSVEALDTSRSYVKNAGHPQAALLPQQKDYYRSIATSTWGGQTGQKELEADLGVRLDPQEERLAGEIARDVANIAGRTVRGGGVMDPVARDFHILYRWVQAGILPGTFLTAKGDIDEEKFAATRGLLHQVNTYLTGRARDAAVEAVLARQARKIGLPIGVTKVPERRVGRPELPAQISTSIPYMAPPMGGVRALPAAEIASFDDLKALAERLRMTTGSVDDTLLRYEQVPASVRTQFFRPPAQPAGRGATLPSNR